MFALIIYCNKILRFGIRAERPPACHASFAPVYGYYECVATLSAVCLEGNNSK